MPPKGEPNATETRGTESLRAPVSSLELVVMGEQSVLRFALPNDSEVVLGRSSDCHIVIAEPGISRKHAVLALRGGALFLRDLGSRNGTLLLGAAISSDSESSFNVGDVVQMGSVTAIVQVRYDGVRPRRLWTHAYFESRLEEECLRAQRTRAPFAILRTWHTLPIEVATVESALARILRADDNIAQYSPGEYEILLVDTTIEDAKRVQHRLLTEIVNEVGPAAEGCIRIGVAGFPRDGSDPETLMAASGRRSSLGIRASLVHSERDALVQSPAMQAIFEFAGRVARSDLNVLILGETGVGKEVLATLLHEKSVRAEQAFVKLNTAALSESLLESELFGYEQGAFTGAFKTTRGLLETANGGTVFLDEIGDMPTALQAKLLRVIEEKRVRRVGGTESIPIDVRFVAATHRDLEHQIQIGQFRQDLYYRLNGVALVIPPLRSRPDDILPLAHYFLRQHGVARGTLTVPDIAPDAEALLREYYWPGNARELRNVIERAAVLAAGATISVDTLPQEKLRAAPLRSAPKQQASAVGSRGLVALAIGSEEATATTELPTVRSELEQIERERILAALAQCQGNRNQAATLLGMPRRTFFRRLKQYGLSSG